MIISYRTERDSMGELEVPSAAYYGAQTQRAVNNFPISDLTMPKQFIRALGYIKYVAAQTNQALGLLAKDKANAIQKAADKVISGEIDDHFPVDVFQTGSGTSSNMNANEVIAYLAGQDVDGVHPNDDVNLGQSSNDTIPTAIHVSAVLAITENLLPALTKLEKSLSKKSEETKDKIKTGRTHLMDAMPVSIGQELDCWAKQIADCHSRIEASLSSLRTLAQGGTAVGTGINAHSDFASQFAANLSKKTQQTFLASDNFFVQISSQDAAVEMSGQLKTLAIALMKISNDLRWMNSGPLAGLAEITLATLQPGSSIMPGKVNPVIPEAVCMVCAQVIGNDTTISVAGQSGSFQLNVMLPVIAYNLLQSIDILSSATTELTQSAIESFTVNDENLTHSLSRNPILVTALNSVIGYEKGAAIAKAAYQQGRPVIDVAEDMTELSRQELEKLLDPGKLTKGGLVS